MVKHVVRAEVKWKAVVFFTPWFGILGRIVIALPLVFAIFASVQYLKGQSILYSVEFGATWALISILIFAVRRAYNLKKRIHYDMSNDLPFHNKIDKAALSTKPFTLSYSNEY